MAVIRMLMEDSRMSRWEQARVMLFSIIKVVVIIAVVAWLWELIFNQPPKWKAAYLVPGNSRAALESYEFDTKEACLSYIKSNPNYVEWQYECGTNCRYEEKYGDLIICDETAKY